MDTENNLTSLRVASFSCYLDTSAETNFVHKIKKAMEADPVSNKSAISNSPRVASFAHYLDTAKENNFAFPPGPPHEKKNLEKTRPKKDGEIDIFGADKYFNMRLDDVADQANTKNEYYAVKKSNFGTRTPSSVYSEASSWNSQTALLRNRLQGNGSHQGKTKKALGRRLIASLACHGPCLDRRSVFVQGSINQGLIEEGSRTSDRFVTRGLNPVKTGPEIVVDLEDPRVSLEVFGQRKGVVIPANLERKVSTLTWDAIPKAPGINSSTTVCDDMASDASSDLFEIENISGSGYGLMSAQDQGDNMSSCMSPTTEHYAPSEASIEWSVVTASAAEYSSVVSDYEERSVSVAGDFIPGGHTRADRFTKSAMGGKAVTGGAPKSRPGGLLGCNSQKALGVAGNVHKIPGKLQASAKVKDIESLQSQHGFAARRLPPSLLN